MNTSEVLHGIDLKELNELSVEFLMVADRAEAIAGKLYVMGGGWDRLSIEAIGAPFYISIAVGILVPWTACNEQQTVAITIEDVDGKPLDSRMDAAFTSARASDAIPGTPQRVMLAFPMVPVTAPKAGIYLVVARLNGVERKRALFTVIGPSTHPTASLPTQRGR